MIAPSTNDRRIAGRFRPGNPGGPGNPFAAKINKLRSKALDCVEPEKIGGILAKLLRLADRCADEAETAEKVSDRLALMREVRDTCDFLLDRTVGKPLQAMLVADERGDVRVDATPDEHRVLLRLLERSRTPQPEGANGNGHAKVVDAEGSVT